MDVKYVPHSKINLESLNVQELANLKKRIDEDISTIMNSFNGFKFVHKQFEEAKVLIHNVSEQKGKENHVLVPLSNSVFIPGRIVDADKFIVDIGTGYFAERNAKQATEHCDHTLAIVKSNGEKMANEINTKQELRDKINVEIQRRLAQRKDAPKSEDFKKH